MVDTRTPPPATEDGSRDEDAAPRRPLLARLIGSAVAAAVVALLLGPAVGLAADAAGIPFQAAAAALLTLYVSAALSFLVEERRGSLADAGWRRVVVGALSGLFFMAAWTWANHVGDPVRGWATLARRLDQLVMELVGGGALGAMFGAPLGAAFFVRTRTTDPAAEALGWLLAAGGPALLYARFGGTAGALVALLGLLGAGLLPLALARAAQLVQAHDPGPLPPPELDPRPALAVAALVVGIAVAITGPHVRPRRPIGAGVLLRRAVKLSSQTVERRGEPVVAGDGGAEAVLEVVVAMAERLRATGRAGASLPELEPYGLAPDPPGQPRLVRLCAPPPRPQDRHYFFGAALDDRQGRESTAWAWIDRAEDPGKIVWWSHDLGSVEPLRPPVRQ